MTYFSETEDRIYYLHSYYPKRFDKQDKDSQNIIEFKNGNDKVIESYATKMIEAMSKAYDTEALKGSYICMIPSHRRGTYSEGLYRLCGILSTHFGLINAHDLIIRIKDHERSSMGGNRSIASHLATLDINKKYSLKGENVIILDDVTTTGNSIAAIRHLLKLKKVKEAYAQTLAKTFNEFYKGEARAVEVDRVVNSNKNWVNTNQITIESNNKMFFESKKNHEPKFDPKVRYEISFEGETYYYKKGEWYTSRMVKAPREMEGKLKKILVAKMLTDKMSEGKN